MSTLFKIWPPKRLFAVVQFLLFVAVANAQDYEIKEAPFNSKEADFSATFNGNEIIFCSTRARKVLSFSEDTVNTYYTDLYSVKLKSDGTYSAPEPLKGKVNTLLNEGQATFSPDGKVMYYTANLPATPGKKAKKAKEFLLGLFKAEKIGDEWIPVGPFEHNSSNGKFSVAHPCYSPDGNYIYFSSNMPGGKGGSDIYRCKWEDGKWSAPENLGDVVNTRGNEFFPFVNDYGTLYFSSDAREDSEGMDIYSSELEDAGYVSVQKLNSTINSEYDDFAYCEIQGVNKGVLSSNRTGDDDNIFLFIKYSNNSNDCLENPDRQLCYAVKDLNLAELTDLPLKYKWNMGDGTELYGSEVEYCYKSPGDYRISLCVVDTLTKSVFADVSHTDIHIDSQSKPYITSTDTIYTGKKFDFFIDLSMFTDFEVNEIIWETSDGESFRGDHATHHFASSGAAQLTCYVKGKKKSNGVVPRVCIYKDIYVTDEEIYSTIEEPVTCCQAKRATVVYMEAGSGEKQADGDDKDYKLVIAKSDKPLPLNDQKFKKVTRKIVEYKEPDSYVYYVEKASTWSDLLPQYSELRKAGITDMSVMEIPSEAEGKELTADMNKTTSSKTTGTKPSTAQSGSKTTAAKQSNSGGQQPNTVNTASASTQTVEGKTKEELQPMVILLSEEKQRLDMTDETFLLLNEPVTEIYKDGKYQYYVPAGIDKAGANKKLTVAQSAGFIEAKIIEEPSAAVLKAISNRANEVVQPKSDVTYYQVKVTSTDRRIPLNDPIFRNVTSNITEIEEDKGYSYVLMNTDKKQNALELLDIYKANKEFVAVLDSSTLDDFTSRIVKTGKYIAPKNADRLNIEFAKLSDIKFEYNSSEILPESYATLDYIAAMLKLEEDFALKINAHTCNIGGQAYNLALSEKRAAAVVDYFIKKDIPKSKLKSKGYGFTQPLSSNMTERGRAANRRVEFIIVFELKK